MKNIFFALLLSAASIFGQYTTNPPVHRDVGGTVAATQFPVIVDTNGIIVSPTNWAGASISFGAITNNANATNIIKNIARTNVDHIGFTLNNADFGGSSTVGTGGNTIQGSVVGGQANNVGGDDPNFTFTPKSTVSYMTAFGYNNYVGATYSSKVGGQDSTIYGHTSGAINGDEIIIETDQSVVGGGYLNHIEGLSNLLPGSGASSPTNGNACVIGGGWGNTISYSSWAAIVGGIGNRITNSAQAFIGGGEGNYITNSADAFITAGTSNKIASATHAVGIGFFLTNSEPWSIQIGVSNVPLTVVSNGNVRVSGAIIGKTNALSTWPTSAATAGGFAIVNSNATVYILTSTPASLTWAATNKLAGP